MLPVAALMQGCEHKDLCYDHSHMTDLRVDFDWSAAPDAEPGTMVVHFFSVPTARCTSAWSSPRQQEASRASRPAST